MQQMKGKTVCTSRKYASILFNMGNADMEEIADINTKTYAEVW